MPNTLTQNIHYAPPKSVDKPTLKLFEITIDPVETHHYMGDWKYVMVLSTDEDSAVDSAFNYLVIPNGRADLTWNVREFNGPFVKGTILSSKTVPAR